MRRGESDRYHLKMVHGRGGTDLRPPFEAQFPAKVRPDVIIYFTAGGGLAPDRPPLTPVIWCLTPEGSRPVAWGYEMGWLKGSIHLAAVP